jgi:hypothetical protein
METTMPEETTAMAPVTVSPEILEQVAIGGDLAGLTAAQRLAYYRALCQSLGLNPLSKPFEYLTLNGKLRLYALRDCADQLRRLHGMSIVITSRERLGDLYLVTARATDRHGRTDESLGAVALGQLKGDALANALMKTETKAKRRVTLSLAGLGWLDETETASIPGVVMGEPNGEQAQTPPATADPQGQATPEARISRDQARELRKVSQTAYGYAAGERRLRDDLGLEAGTPITLMRLEAHVSPAQYATLIQTYEGALKAEVEADVPDDHELPAPETGGPVMVTPVEPSGDQPPGEAVTGEVTPGTPPHGQPPTTEVEDRQHWYRLSRRSMRAGLSPTVWESLRAGDYVSAERVIVALEQAPTNGPEGRGVDG